MKKTVIEILLALAILCLLAVTVYSIILLIVSSTFPSNRGQLVCVCIAIIGTAILVRIFVLAHARSMHAELNGRFIHTNSWVAFTRKVCVKTLPSLDFTDSSVSEWVTVHNGQFGKIFQDHRNLDLASQLETGISQSSKVTLHVPGISSNEKFVQISDFSVIQAVEERDVPPFEIKDSSVAFAERRTQFEATTELFSDSTS